MDRYCVIADKTLSSYTCRRSWTANQHEAELHAANLLRQEGAKPGERLLVVKVVSVVEVDGPPVRVRELNEYDLPNYR